MSRFAIFAIFACFALASILAACVECLCFVPSPLAGTFTCDDMTCQQQQICRASRNLPDDGGIPALCVTVPADCSIVDCASTNTGTTCSDCIRHLCVPVSSGEYASVTGRELHCD